MDNLSYCKTMAEYNHWMNQKLYKICAEVPDVKRRENLGAFFKSIHGTLNHILVGDRVWLGRFTKQPFLAKLDQEIYPDFDELRQERELTDQQITAWCDRVSSKWLNQPFTYTGITSPIARVRPGWLLVTHFFNHQTHHRGQIATLLSQLGYDLGVTDLPYLPSLETQ